MLAIGCRRSGVGPDRGGCFGARMLMPHQIRYQILEKSACASAGSAMELEVSLLQDEGAPKQANVLVHVAALAWLCSMTTGMHAGALSSCSSWPIETDLLIFTLRLWFHAGGVVYPVDVAVLGEA